MYTEEEWMALRRQAASRLRTAIIPAAVAFAAAIGLFVYGQVARSERLWIVTAALTILAGCYFLFLFGVYVRPVRLYEKHVDLMLHGRRHQTEGVIKAFGDKPCEKNGVDCYPLMLNVGDRDDGVDDRLFYFDAHKARPDFKPGQRVTIQSNDIMVADYQGQ